MIESSLVTVTESLGHAAQCPARTSRDLHRASGRLIGASIRLQRAARSLRDTARCAAGDDGVAVEVPLLLRAATQRWMAAWQFLEATQEQLFLLHEGLVEGLETGELVPEPEKPARRRFVIAPHIVYAREFLQCRRTTARDRISSVPIRRRRPRCRATADAPRRICRGRAPPSLSTCLL